MTTNPRPRPKWLDQLREERELKFERGLCINAPLHGGPSSTGLVHGPIYAPPRTRTGPKGKPRNRRCFYCYLVHKHGFIKGQRLYNEHLAASAAAPNAAASS